MSKLKDYLEQKRISQLGLPKIYVVKSTRDGVNQPLECQVVNVEVLSDFNIVRYHIKDCFPYQIDIKDGELFAIEEGYGSGFGDLWAWTYFCSPSLEEANNFFEQETERVKEKYL